MKRLNHISAAAAVFLVVLAAVITAADAQPGSPQLSVRDLFERGNQLYEAGEYEEAAGVYEEAALRGAVIPDLYYNLGNAYYKAGNIGRAVLNFERAIRMVPRDGDVRANLGLARSLLRDDQFVEESGIVKRILTRVNGWLNFRESLVFTSVLYGLLSLVIIGFIFRETRFVSRFYPLMFMVSPGRILGLDKSQDFVLAMTTLFVLLSASGVSTYGKYRAVTSRKAAIIIEQEAAVFGGPSDDSTLQFKIHEGTKVNTGETRPGWVQIRLPGDLSGWVSSRSLEKI